MSLHIASRLICCTLAVVASATAGAANDLHDLTGFYTSSMAMGPPQILAADGITFVPNPAPPFPGDDTYTKMNCIPDTAFGYNPYGEQLVMTPGRLTWINQYNHIIRRIDIDQPPPKKLRRTYTGYSAAHWQGDTLVVETTALRKIHVRGTPAWRSIERIIERIRKIDDGRTLERVTRFEATTTDGKPDTSTTRATYTLQNSQHLYEFICEDAAGRFADAEDAVR